MKQTVNAHEHDMAVIMFIIFFLNNDLYIIIQYSTIKDHGDLHLFTKSVDQKSASQ